MSASQQTSYFVRDLGKQALKNAIYYQAFYWNHQSKWHSVRSYLDTIIVTLHKRGPHGNAMQAVTKGRRPHFCKGRNHKYNVINEKIKLENKQGKNTIR